jgi:hypothetical protein
MYYRESALLDEDARLVMQEEIKGWRKMVDAAIVLREQLEDALDDKYGRHWWGGPFPLHIEEEGAEKRIAGVRFTLQRSDAKYGAPLRMAYAVFGEGPSVEGKLTCTIRQKLVRSPPAKPSADRQVGADSADPGKSV